MQEEVANAKAYDTDLANYNAKIFDLVLNTNILSQD